MPVFVRGTIIINILDHMGIQLREQDLQVWNSICHRRAALLRATIAATAATRQQQKPQKPVAMIIIEDDDDAANGVKNDVDFGSTKALSSASCSQTSRGPGSLSRSQSASSIGTLLSDDGTIVARPTGLRLTELEAMNKNELIKLLLITETRNASLRNNVCKFKITQKRLTRSINKGSAKLVIAIKQLDTAEKQLAISRKGRGDAGRGGRLTSQSIFAVGIRRGMVNTSALDFGISTLDDVSHQTVCRCEVKTGAALASSSRLYFAELLLSVLLMEDDDVCETDAAHTIPSLVVAAPIAAGPGSIGDGCFDSDEMFTLCCIRIRCDATHSSIWQRRKLHVLEVGASYIHDYDAFTSGQFQESLRNHTIVTDIQAVMDGSAAGTLALIEKQLSSVGCPTWRQLAGACRTLYLLFVVWLQRSSVMAHES